MKCPHCLNNFFSKANYSYLGVDSESHWFIEYEICPSCRNIIMFKIESGNVDFMSQPMPPIKNKILIHPKGINRPPVPVEVPDKYAKDYKEACLVVIDSPKASAALSRRCLQNIIRENLKIVKKDLNSEIDEVINTKVLPSDVLDSIDAIRNIGNFAAHPIKSKSSGEIVEVEPDEAEWNLDVLEMIFDFLFVRPEKVKMKKDALNQKLKDAGKPNLK